jgi:UDP-glucose:(heptosyl)LPS alpha-1,3-glucosyltransferase
VANDFARKGLDALLGAMVQLKKQAETDPTFKVPLLMIVGGGQAAINSYQKKAELLGVGSDVRFEGAQKNMYAYYCAADVLAHPTLEDSFGMVVLEALAHHLSVVVSGAPYCGISARLVYVPEVYILSDPQNTEELVLGIANFLNQGNANMAKPDATNSIVHYLNNATWSDSIKKYKKLIGNGFA